MAGYAALGGGVIGGIVGAQKNRYRLSQAEAQATDLRGQSLAEYQRFVANGPTRADYDIGTQSQRDLASLLEQYRTSSTGLYDMQRGNSLAEQQFAPQRQLLDATLQQQVSEANRQASLMGRNTNDPILRARLAQSNQMQQLQLAANQQQAAMGYAREAGTDSLNLATNRANTLSALGQQGLQNQGNLFNMANQVIQAERSFSLARPQEGGGWLGALTGAANGASSAFGAAQGFGGISGGSQVAPPQGAPTGIPAAASTQSWYSLPQQQSAPFYTLGGAAPAAQTFQAAPQAARAPQPSGAFVTPAAGNAYGTGQFVRPLGWGG